jgi:alkanesulfonate monooxygenase SsuD/methylene tetrahydromethanopterin reductase-like flavin-dependent oxidoreductase (luciferase family)
VPWTALREVAELGEAVGFDTLMAPDHLLFRRSPPGNVPAVDMPEGKSRGIWEAWSVLSSVAAITRGVQLGPLVACTGFRNPALLAKMAETLDEISGGRLLLGLGAGWHQPEFEAFGYPFDHRVGRFEEALRIIVPLLREGQVDFEGQYYRARDCEIRPRGPRPSGVPIFIGAQGPRMMRLCARYADHFDAD